MQLPEKVNLPVQKTKGDKKIPNKNFNLNLIFSYISGISFFPTLILTIILWLLDIKTIFWEERGPFRHRWFRGYIAVFVMLWLFITFASMMLYFFFFLIKSLLQKKDKNQRKKAGKYLLTFIINQLAFNPLLFWLWKNLTKSNSIQILLTSFLLIISNSFFIHYFFSKPATKLLSEKYPHNLFSENSFRTSTRKVGSLKFKRIESFGWALTITLILANFWIFSQLYYLKLFPIK